MWGFGGQLFIKVCSLNAINVCPLAGETCHLVLTHLKLNPQKVISHFQIRTVPESHYLKSSKFYI